MTKYTVTRQGRDYTWQPAMTDMQRDRAAAPFEADSWWLGAGPIKLACWSFVVLFGALLVMVS